MFRNLDGSIDWKLVAIALVSLAFVVAGIYWAVTVDVAPSNKTCNWEYGYGLKMDGKFGWGMVRHCK